MKRRACKRLLTAAVLCAALTVPAKAAQRSVPVQIDGKPIAVSAYVERGVTYVPLRALLNTMGAWDVWWDEATGRAAAASDDTHLWADPAADTVTVDEKTVRGRVTVENGVTYVPLRLVGEALGCQVEWDPYLGGRGSDLSRCGLRCRGIVLAVPDHLRRKRRGVNVRADRRGQRDPEPGQEWQLSQYRGGRHFRPEGRSAV